ncbi:MAG: response regulator [Candidatus Tenebribacter burtonii]|nr:response regulator [Candidatus Tenebribacter burtonii]
MTKILIVEDERMIAEDIKYILNHYNYEIVGIFKNGKDAIDSVSKKKPDIILMDIMLEGDINGIDTGRIILKDHDIPIIFLTAFADTETVESAKNVTPYGYILKPFEQAELYAAIEIALIKHNTEKKLYESNAQFESMFLGNPEPCVYLNNDFEIVDINPKFKELFGFSLIDIKDKKINSVIIPDGYNEEAAELNNDTLDGYVYFDTLRKKNDGNLIPVSISAAPIIIKGEPRGSFVIYKDISKRKKVEEERKKLIKKLQKTLDEIKTLEGLIPICSHCKKIRDDSGYWSNVEQYISKHSNIDFSHGICPDCLEKYYPKQYLKMKKNGKI